MAADIHARSESLEDQFFRDQDKALIARLAELKRVAGLQDALCAVSGIEDPRVLQRLVELEITPEVFVAMAVVPLVEVAWADGEVSPQERQAVLEAARSQRGGAEPLVPGLLESWLERKPQPRLLAAWKVYVQGLCTGMQRDERERLRDQIVGHARRVAQASGGILGLGSKISAAEEKVLAGLSSAFEA